MSLAQQLSGAGRHSAPRRREARRSGFLLTSRLEGAWVQVCVIAPSLTVYEPNIIITLITSSGSSSVPQPFPLNAAVDGKIGALYNFSFFLSNPAFLIICLSVLIDKILSMCRNSQIVPLNVNHYKFQHFCYILMFLDCLKWPSKLNTAETNFLHLKFSPWEYKFCTKFALEEFSA